MPMPALVTDNNKMFDQSEQFRGGFTEEKKTITNQHL